MASFRLLLSVLALLIIAPSCEGEQGEAGTAAKAVDQTQLEGEDDDLLSRRDALLNARNKLRGKRADLTARRTQIIRDGGDTANVDKESQALDVDEKKLSTEETAFKSKLDQILSERRAMAAFAVSGDQTARREGQVASREKDFARREKTIAEREAGVAARERALAKREAETCGVATTTIVQTVQAEGATNYGKRDVAPLLKKARTQMRKKRLLSSDLPASAQDLEQKAVSFMKKAAYGRAHLAADQLLKTVRGIRINKAFVNAKMARLNVKLRSRTLSDSQQSQVERSLQKVSKSFLDGRYRRANGQLNDVFRLVR